jgi:hypothetical protein
MKRLLALPLIIIFLFVSCSAFSTGINKKSVDSANIEKVECIADKNGNYYVYVTIKNISDKDKPFYLAIQADDQVAQFTASGKKGQPNLVPAGKNYTFEVNTWKKTEPKRLQIEVKESLR